MTVRIRSFLETVPLRPGELRIIGKLRNQMLKLSREGDA